MAADRVNLVAARAAALSLHVLRCPSSPLCCGHQGEDCRPTQLGGPSVVSQALNGMDSMTLSQISDGLMPNIRLWRGRISHILKG